MVYSLRLYCMVWILDGSWWTDGQKLYIEFLRFGIWICRCARSRSCILGLLLYSPHSLPREPCRRLAIARILAHPRRRSMLRCVSVSHSGVLKSR